MPGRERTGSGFARACVSAAGFALFWGASSPGPAWADILSGNAEWSYTLLNSKPETATTANPKTTTESFIQKYNIALNVNPYPHLRFSAGSLFELDRSSSESGGFETSSSVDTYFPYVDLTLATPLFSTGVGYSRKQDRVKGTGVPKTTTINEEYHATFGWKPEGFPTTSVRLSRTNNYDAARVSSDSTTDYASLGMRFAPAKGVDLRYQGTYTDTTDHLGGLEASTLTHNGLAGYSGQFFNQRVFLYSSYNFTRQDTTISALAGGEVETRLFPFAALSAFNDTPTSAAPEQNVSNAALIDGDFTASAGIDLGPQPLGTNPNARWSIGVDFINPAAMNTLIVWVDRQLPAAVESFFENSANWAIFVRGTETEEWRTGPAITGVEFGSFLNSSGQSSFGFRIRFDNVATRFIKAVVTPLDPNQAPLFKEPIFVTEFQAFTTVPAQQLERTATFTSHFYNLNVRTRILNSPSLYHTLSLLLTSAGTSGSTRYTLSNTLNLSHRLSRVFTVGANVGFEDSEVAAGHSTAFLYNASVKATPLVGLSHTLLYSGRSESVGGNRSDTNAVFLYNAAQPYKGISLNLSGGVSESSSDTGGTTESLQLITGASVTPMKELSLNLSYSHSDTTTSGGSGPDSTTSTQTGTFSTAYRPFPSLYLFVSFGMVGRENTQAEYIQNYGLNWSPFSDGDLQFNFNYSESLSSRNDVKNTLISPSISWKVAARTILDVSYPIIFSESATQSTETTIFSATLRTSF